MGNLRKWLKGLKQYPSLAVGLLLVALFAVVSIYTVIAIPYTEAVDRWSDTSLRLENPRLARPVWFDWFTSDSLPRTFNITLDDEETIVREEPLADGMKRVTVTFPFEYDYDGFPSHLRLFTRWTYEATERASISVLWQKPDGEQITLTEIGRVPPAYTYYISSDRDLRAVLNAPPHEGLFAVDPSVPSDEREVLYGDYAMILRADMPETASLDMLRLVVFGRVHGWAGTDHLGRDLLLALMWGAPVGLAFGILAAVGAQMSTFVLAGIATWFGGRTERIMQWITQVNIILPVLPILIMIAHLYQPRLWTILGLVIALNIFSGAMLTYRAMFLQLKEAPYIEAAQAYGAGNFRIIFRYLLPRIAPTLLPQFVMVIPSFVFLEAALAVLGLGDPYLPTWGKVLNDAYTSGALYHRHYYWIVQPAVLLMGIGFAFSLVGFALDRIFNPRLRQI